MEKAKEFNSMDKLKVFMKKNTMLIALVIVTLFFQVKTGGTLLAPRNVTNLISQNGYVVILAVGMLMCILTGGNIDLSVGSIVALVGALAGTLIVTKGMNVYLAIAICLGVGILIGIWQGFWIAYVRIPAFIVTLSGMLLWRGVALMILGGLTISPFPEKYLNLFNSYIPDPFGGQINMMCMIVAIVVCV
ncbi:ABC transporter permease subunit, partial [Terrisporobacter hibernicus]